MRLSTVSSYIFPFYPWLNCEISVDAHLKLTNRSTHHNRGHWFLFIGFLFPKVGSPEHPEFTKLMSVIMLSHRHKDQPSPGERITPAGERPLGDGEQAGEPELDGYRNRLEVVNVHLVIAKCLFATDVRQLRKNHGKTVEKVGFGCPLEEPPLHRGGLVEKPTTWGDDQDVLACANRLQHRSTR
jgi:hypothetical protein